MSYAWLEVWVVSLSYRTQNNHHYIAIIVIPVSVVVAYTTINLMKASIALHLKWCKNRKYYPRFVVANDYSWAKWWRWSHDFMLMNSLCNFSTTLNVCCFNKIEFVCESVLASVMSTIKYFIMFIDNSKQSRSFCS